MLYCWISPEGAFFDCEFMAHYDLAEEICEARGYSTIINGKSKPADDVLVENHDWIKAYSSLFDRQHIQLYTNWNITEIQKQILRDDYFEHPENWDRHGKFTLEELGVIESEYDESRYNV